MSQSEIANEIAELEATPRVMIGTDQGTGSPNDSHDLYETITGERYAIYSFAGANGTRCTIERAIADTQGYIRWFPESQKTIRAKQKRLKELRRMA
jgi:hypothetical protein